MTTEKANEYKALVVEIEAIEEDMTQEEKEAFNFKPKKDIFVEKLTEDEIKVLKRLEDST